jgi:hypothetical protein
MIPESGFDCRCRLRKHKQGQGKIQECIFIMFNRCFPGDLNEFDGHLQVKEKRKALHKTGTRNKLLLTLITQRAAAYDTELSI